MLTRFSEIKPFNSFRLKVSDLHEIYVEECGNPAGIPLVVVHGGPGAGCNAGMRRFFDPNRYRIILYDQRGAGRSTPHASLEQNTTADLVADLEKIRERLSLESLILFGGSWGSTLALVYAQIYPHHVLALILRGIFLARGQDFDWLYRFGASQVFPDYWEDFERLIPEEERADLMAAYHKRLTGTDELNQMAAAKAWSIWEARCATLRPNPEVLEYFAGPHVAIALARIEAHYFVNQGFLEPDQILRDAPKLAEIPGIIVHGRYDMVCPIDQAFALHRVWAESKLVIVREAGHSSLEPGTVDALVRATNEMASRFHYLVGKE